MPIFDLKCQECDHVFEFLVRNDEEVQCPECHSSNTERLMSAPSFILKGGGWYKPSPQQPNRPPSEFTNTNP